jgi:hypothetical protein
VGCMDVLHAVNVPTAVRTAAIDVNIPDDDVMSFFMPGHCAPKHLAGGAAKQDEPTKEPPIDVISDRDHERHVHGERDHVLHEGERCRSKGM